MEEPIVQPGSAAGSGTWVVDEVGQAWGHRWWEGSTATGTLWGWQELPAKAWRAEGGHEVSSYKNTVAPLPGSPPGLCCPWPGLQ